MAYGDMPKKAGDIRTVDFERAAQLLETHWQTVVTEGSAKSDLEYVDDAALREAIRTSVSHKQVAYRFCLPVQLLGKITDPNLDCLRLQKRKGDRSDLTGWDARSLASKVVAPFNLYGLIPRSLLRGSSFNGRKTFSARLRTPTLAIQCESLVWSEMIRARKM